LWEKLAKKQELAEERKKKTKQNRATPKGEEITGK